MPSPPLVIFSACFTFNCKMLRPAANSDDSINGSLTLAANSITSTKNECTLAGQFALTTHAPDQTATRLRFLPCTFNLAAPSYGNYPSAQSDFHAVSRAAGPKGQESQWLLKLHTYELLNNSFQPPAEIRVLRTYWRQRAEHVSGAATCIQRMQKALTQMNLQLSNVIS